VRRPAEEPRDVLREYVEHLAGRLAASEALGIRRKNGKIAIPSGRQLSTLHLLDLGREVGVLPPVGLEQRRPALSRLGAARPDAGSEVLAHVVRDQELCVLRPAIATLREADFLGTERLAVDGGCVVLVRRAPAGVAGDDEGSGMCLCFS